MAKIEVHLAEKLKAELNEAKGGKTWLGLIVDGARSHGFNVNYEPAKIGRPSKESIDALRQAYSDLHSMFDENITRTKVKPPEQTPTYVPGQVRAVQCPSCLHRFNSSSQISTCPKCGHRFEHERSLGTKDSHDALMLTVQERLQADFEKRQRKLAEG